MTPSRVTYWLVQARDATGRCWSPQCVTVDRTEALQVVALMEAELPGIVVRVDRLRLPCGAVVGEA